MRVMQSISSKFRQLRANKLIVASAFVMAVTLAGVGVYQFNQTAADAASPCNAQTNNIVPNGTHSYADVTRNYNANTCGDLKAIYNHYWIKPNLAAGDKVYNGTSKNDGTVVANGRIVAKNAASIGRHNIHSTSKRIAINGQTYYQTSHVGGKAFANPSGSLPTLVVLDKDGNFKYAIVKACGNPIYATPVNPPKPPEPPVVKDIQVCELKTKTIITIKEDQFNPELHSKNLKDCEEKTIQVCELATKKVITIKESEFDAEKHSKNLADCKDKYIKVCELDTKKVITIKEDEFDAEKHSKNLEDCKEVIIQVCDLETKKIIKINEEQFDPAKHSKNLADCKTPEKIVVCDLESKTVITINKDQYDETKHSTDLKDCEEKCPIPGKEHLPATSAECEEPVVPTPVEPEAPTPEALPETGAGDVLGASIGLVAMFTAAYYYAASRRII